MNKIFIFLIMVCPQVFSQSIISWTEDNGVLGLGYPVPIPVDTPEPFDGFRTYSGLFAKHQSIALENDYISGQIVGKTRANRDIWAYMMSDENNLTMYGVKEGAMLINGNIHAREWQTPEVQTGIMELLHANSQDNGLHQYLLENTSIVTIPVNNIDGLLQTQRYPTQNWYGNTNGPRDGRMRRKNMFNVDEILSTSNDFLFGVDLNRNNNPYWASSNSSSSDVTSIVHHGPSSQSEPETQARIAAANLVDVDQVRIYTDVHSFSQVHFSVRTNNTNRTTLMRNLLSDFSNHHAAFPANVFYQDRPSGPGNGIGSTDEYFAETYQVPSWTLEVEPRNGGVDYGGFGNNGHDGFILPESEITRVREQLADTFMVAWYGQAGPPSITSIKILLKNDDNDRFDNLVVADFDWDIMPDGTRQLYKNEVDSLIASRSYKLLIQFDKPMRSRNENNEIAHLQGQSGYDLNPTISLNIDNSNFNVTNGNWVNAKDNSVLGYKFYKDDTYIAEFTIPANTVTTDGSNLGIAIDVADMVGQKLDANPATIVSWANGQWNNYNDESGADTIVGGVDNNYFVNVAPYSEDVLYTNVAATGIYYDPTRSGEGFTYELLSGNKVWLQWFTYDAEGNQLWLTGLGKVVGNTITIDNLLKTTGGTFGSELDTNNISHANFGSIEVIFDVIDTSSATRFAKAVFTDTQGKKLRTGFQLISNILGGVSSSYVFIGPPTTRFYSAAMVVSGSWYDPARSGEGYILQVLEDDRVVVLWYTYDLQGNLMWLIGSDGVVTVKGHNVKLDFDEVLVTNGGIFGEDFNPDEVNRVPWGELHFEMDCLDQTGTVNYSSIIDGFDDGEYSIKQLTHPSLQDVAHGCHEN